MSAIDMNLSQNVGRPTFYSRFLSARARQFNREDAKTQGDVLDDPKLVNDIAATGIPAATLADADAIVEHLAPDLRCGDVVAIMSNGGFGGIHDKILNVLKN